MRVAAPRSNTVESFYDLWQAAASPWQQPMPPSTVQITSGSGDPIFFVHWSTGNVRFIGRFADGWRTGRPIVGLEAIGLESRLRPLLSVVEIAEHYLHEIRTIQPTGPYALVGLCSGGQIVYEMARRLSALGEDIEYLAVVNCIRPGVSFVPGWGLDELYKNRLTTLRKYFDITDPDTESTVLYEGAKERFWLNDSAELRDIYWLQLLWSASLYAQEHYEAHPYEGPIEIFRSSSIRPPFKIPWDELASDARTTVIEGSDSPSLLQHPTFAQSLSGLE